MSTAASPVSSSSSPATPSSARRRGRRRGKKKSGRGLRILLWTTGSLIAIAAAGWFGFSAWLRSYLRGDSFRSFLSGKISTVLNAEGSIDSITWRDSAAWVDEYRADGYQGAAFRSISVQDIRAGIDTGAIWDRVWKIENVKIARLRIDATEGRKPAPPAEEPAPAGSGGSAPGWLARFIPNRTVLGEISVGETEAIWRDGAQTVQVSKLPLSLRTTDNRDAAVVSGRGGELLWSGLPDLKFRLDAIDFTARAGEVRIDRLDAESTSGSPHTRLTADALITKDPEGTGLRLNGKLTGLDVRKIIPENWLQRLSGRVTLDGKLTGIMQKRDTLLATGRFSLTNGILEALPMLEIIARKTRNEAFAHLQLREASSDCSWSTRLLDLDRILVDCPGLLRLRGRTMILPGEVLQGDLLVGIAPKTLSYVAGAEDHVFLPLDQLKLTAVEMRWVDAEDKSMRWARLKLGGTLSNPAEDLSDRLAMAWFNATVDEVLNMTMEEAIQRAEQLSRAAADLAGSALEEGGKLLEKAPEVIGSGVEAGGKAVEAGAGLINDLINPK